MRLTTLLLASIVSLPAIASDFFPGENLITPYELDADQWDVLQKNEGSARGVMWRSKAKGFDDLYVVNVYTGSSATLAEMRAAQDAPGRANCDSFESIDLDPIPSRNYDALRWRTVCTNGADFKAQILHLVIVGKDSLYHLQKIWRGETSDAEVAQWVTRFDKVLVCDTRDAGKACPDGYNRVGPLSGQ